MTRIAAAAALISSLAVAAQAQPASQLPEPVLPSMPAAPAEIAEGGYAVSGMDDPSEWQFVMGPRGPDAMMHLSRGLESSSLMFRCSRRTGRMEMALVSRGYRVGEATTEDVQVSVGSERHPVRMRADIPPEGEENSALSADGVVVSDLLAAMATSRTYPEMLTFQWRGRKAEFPIGGNRTVHRISGLICSGWSRTVAEGAQDPARTSRP